MILPGVSRAELWVWRGRDVYAEVAFLGKGSPASSEECLLQLGIERKVSYLKQIHSAVPRAAGGGYSGEGDALWTGRRDSALAVVTADCVPVLLAARGRVAAIHAGWRGIVAGVVPATLSAWSDESIDFKAWIGPSIGPCCYEVGEEVASKVVSTSGPQVLVRPQGRSKPYLDLQEAVALQLAKAGAVEIERVPLCTRCEENSLWSYRRDGVGAGRNRALIWLRDAKAEDLTLRGLGSAL